MVVEMTGLEVVDLSLLYIQMVLDLVVQSEILVFFPSLRSRS